MLCHMISGLLFFQFTAVSLADEPPSLDPSILEVITSQGQRNAFRVILGRRDDSPFCFLEKYEYSKSSKNLEKRVSSWNCRDLPGGDQIGLEKNAYLSELEETVYGIRFKATKAKGKFLTINNVCTIDPYTPPATKITCKQNK